MKHDDRPIGIFDSGIGGLTVAHALRTLLPSESIVYFGDTAHLPYGDKSAESIKHYSMEIATMLYQHDCKAILIACNTASAYSFQSIRKAFGNKLPVMNVIDPVAAYVGETYTNRKVGVIGTRGTISSRIYPKRIRKYNKSTKVTQLATPLLAPMIEEGFFNNNISQTIINSYLSKKSFQGIEALILGCTHYPLIKKEVKKYYKGATEIIDSADVVARHVGQTLANKELLRSAGKPKDRFYVSDFTASFEKSTRIFFHDRIHLEEMRIWD